MTTYKCLYCNKGLDKFNYVIPHLVENHGNNELKYIRMDNNKFRTLNFKIIPDMCREQGRTITMTETEMEVDDHYIYPIFVNHIFPRDHLFDTRVRAKRKARRKIATVAGPDEAARSVAPVREHHKCDESKILPHKRLGIDIK